MNMKDDVQNKDALSAGKFFTLLAVSISCFMEGLVTFIPFPILVTESMKLGLTSTEAELVLISLPLASIVTFFIQPHVSQWSRLLFTVITGSVGFCTAALFYFSHQFHGLYLYIAVTARLLSGIVHYLLINKIGVIFTIQFDGNTARSSMCYEVSVVIGQSVGAYIGAILDARVGFRNTMLINSFLVLAVVIAISMFKTTKSVDESTVTDDQVTKESTRKEGYKLYFTCFFVVHIWIVMFCIGACMTFLRGNLTYFYTEVYEKRDEFSGTILGESCFVYALFSALGGWLGNRNLNISAPMMSFCMISIAILLVLLGPVYSISPFLDICLSVLSFNLIEGCSSLVQYAVLTHSTTHLAATMTAEEAMSITLSVFFAAKNVGGATGIIVAGPLLNILSFRWLFAVGTPFFIFSGLAILFYNIGPRKTHQQVATEDLA